MQKKEKNFSLAGDSTENHLSRELTRLCDGLFYTSESDASIEVFIGQIAEEISRGEILKQTGHADSDVTEEIPIDDFFEKLTIVREWYNTERAAGAARFSELKQYLEDSLTDERVFRIGKIQIEIFVVGLDTSGRIVGIKTRAVET